MARAIDQIQTDIAALETSVVAIAQELHQAYTSYLEALGVALRRQYIQACYHLCTHGYPEQFLKLSLSDRQALQKRLRQMAAQAKQELLKPLQPPSETEANPEEENLTEQALANEPDRLPISLDIVLSNNLPQGDLVLRGQPEPTPESVEGHRFDQEEEGSGSSDTEDDPVIDLDESEDESDDSIEQALLMKIQDAILLNLMGRKSGNSEDRDDFEEDDEDEDYEDFIDINQIRDRLRQIKQSAAMPRPVPFIQPEQIRDPADLLEWQDAVEESTADLLRELSHATNHLLQRAKILPGALPEQLLELAAKSGMAAEATAGPPNLLSLLIEAQTDEHSPPEVMPLMALRLRLAEIEFSDSELTHWRHQIRNLMLQVQKLQQNYQKRQQERAIAEAEGAWRASWYED
jgi:hypothetical protein